VGAPCGKRARGKPGRLPPQRSQAPRATAICNRLPAPDRDAPHNASLSTSADTARFACNTKHANNAT
jgi:hypothetical protein